MEPEIVLRLKKVTKMFAGTLALDGVDLEIKRGEIHGLIGKNGAGKSTLVNIIAGVLEPTEGEIVLEGQVLKSLSRSESREKKIAIVPQEPQVVLDYTVTENLFMPDYIISPIFRNVNFKAMQQKAQEIVDQAGFEVNVEALASDLTVSERQLLLVVKAAYVEDARIIILDEASASLSQKDEELFFNIVRKIREEGNTVIFISHHIDEILSLCDRITVLRDGTTIGSFECTDLDTEKTSHLIIGEELDEVAVPSEKAGKPVREFGENVLSVQSLTKAGVFKDISFEIKQGEILGFAGLRGSGRTEIFKCIVGADDFDYGHIACGEVHGHFKDPADAQKNGLVYLPEDREGEGIVEVLSVRENLILNSLKKITNLGLINRKKESQQVQALVDLLDIKIASPEQEISQLSGGNKQKVVVGRIMGAEPRVFILDEPTRGIDIVAKASILKIIADKLSKEAGILITSPGIEELMQICDRIIVLYGGEIVKEFHKKDFSEKNIYFTMQSGRNNLSANGNKKTESSELEHKEEY